MGYETVTWISGLRDNKKIKDHLLGLRDASDKRAAIRHGLVTVEGSHAKANDFHILQCKLYRR